VSQQPNHAGPQLCGGTEDFNAPLPKYTGPSDALLSRAVAIVKGGHQPPPPPDVSTLPAMLAEAAEAQLAAQNAHERLSAAQAERDAALVELHQVQSDLHEGKTEDEVLRMIGDARARLDKAELHERRAAAVISATDSVASKKAVTVARAAVDAAEKTALRAAVQGTQELLALLHPNYVQRQPAEAREIVMPVVRHMRVVSEFGTIAKNAAPSIGAFVTTGRAETRRACLADAGKIVARLCPAAPSDETSKPKNRERGRKE
jgi:hypothetical protein